MTDTLAEEALRLLDTAATCIDPEGRSVMINSNEVATIRSALTQAAREQRAMRSIEGWIQTPAKAPLRRLELTALHAKGHSPEAWRVAIDGGLVAFGGVTLPAALEAAAAWCEQQGEK